MGIAQPWRLFYREDSAITTLDVDAVLAQVDDIQTDVHSVLALLQAGNSFGASQSGVSNNGSAQTTLFAVNSCLRAMGICPLADEAELTATTDPDVAQAVAELEAARSELLSKGMLFNQGILSLTPSTVSGEEGHIDLVDVLSFDLIGSHYNQPLRVKDDKMWDDYNQSHDMSDLVGTGGSVQIRAQMNMSFADMPEPAKTVVIYSAREMLITDVDSDPAKLKANQRRLISAYSALERLGIRNSNLNYLTTSEPASVLSDLRGIYSNAPYSGTIPS